MSDNHHSKTGEALFAQLFDGLVQCSDLVGASGGALGLHAVGPAGGAIAFGPPDAERCDVLLRRIGQRHGLAAPRFIWPAPGAPTSLETALSRAVGLGLPEWSRLAALESVALDAALGDVAVPATYRRQTVKSEGLPALDAFLSGRRSEEAFLIVPPSGVPASLFRPWMEALGRDHYTLVLENPGLFGDWQRIDAQYGSVADEVAFIHAAVAAFGLKRVHLVGICGGAPIAVAAAATEGAHAASVVVCHGDLYFGPDTPRTPFQKQFQGLLAEATASAARAREVHALFLDPAMLFGVPAHLAPFILYPYADAALFRRYARCNLGRMAYDATSDARRIRCDLTVVTSKVDRMTHPEASRMLHRLVAGSRLVEKETGNHHDVLLPSEDMLRTIAAQAKEPA